MVRCAVDTQYTYFKVYFVSEWYFLSPTKLSCYWLIASFALCVFLLVSFNFFVNTLQPKKNKGIK